MKYRETSGQSCRTSLLDSSWGVPVPSLAQRQQGPSDPEVLRAEARQAERGQSHQRRTAKALQMVSAVKEDAVWKSWEGSLKNGHGGVTL